MKVVQIKKFILLCGALRLFYQLHQINYKRRKQQTQKNFNII